MRQWLAVVCAVGCCAAIWAYLSWPKTNTYTYGYTDGEMRVLLFAMALPVILWLAGSAIDILSERKRRLGLMGLGAGLGLWAVAAAIAALSGSL